MATTFEVAVCRPLLATVRPFKVMVVVAVVLMAHAAPRVLTCSVMTFEVTALGTMRALPAMKASAVPEKGAVPTKVIARALPVPVPAAMEPAVELNAMTRLWHVLLAWHDDGIVTDVTWYPEMGPLG